MAYIVLVHRVLVPCHPCPHNDSWEADIPAKTTPSLTGATIAGSIVFGVLFFVIVAALLYYGYHARLPSPALLPRTEAAQTDDWANRACELVRVPRALIVGRLRRYHARRFHLRPRTDLHAPTAGTPARSTPIPYGGSLAHLPPPPYDPSFILPPYASHEIQDAAHQSPAALEIHPHHSFHTDP
ncbi:hypothetical protein GY45DRAFT_132538 [Cubamyces sp. BRFM 1775]|nr:hypothetical protein GY45DRAFT_132538 [Cubamyces sp. BRFM 1775]